MTFHFHLYMKFSKLTNHSDGGKCWSCDKFFPPKKFNGSPKITERTVESSNLSKARTKPLLTLERVHTYWTHDGNNYLMQVRVFRDNDGRKSCFQYRWNGILTWDTGGLFKEEGQWLSGLDGVQLTLYYAPLLIMLQLCTQSYKDKTHVFIVEGEKDCETLRKQNVIATCNPLGAGKWRNEYSELLRGLTCIIIPDNDPAGYKHAASVLQSLNGIAKKATIVNITTLMPDLPPKGDISDYFELGGKL